MNEDRWLGTMPHSGGHIQGHLASQRRVARSRTLALMYALAIHGGAGARAQSERARQSGEAHRQGLSEALLLAQRVLEADGAALDAVEVAVAALEDNPLFNAGRGAVLTLDGTAELDAAIMDGRSLRAGAVAQVRRSKNPIRVARRVLEQLPHVFLVGDGADAYAAQVGLSVVSNDYFITPERQGQLAALQATLGKQPGAQPGAHPGQQPGQAPAARDELPLGTVGAVARDQAGRLAAATSTGGMLGQRSGRVGDSPVIGAGTYADDETCAVSTTGEGEWFLRTVLAYDIAARLRYRGDSLARAVDAALDERLTRFGGRGGVIAVDRGGAIVMRYNTASMLYARVASGAKMQVHVD